MHCLEFRRRLLEDPYQNSKELLEHEASCPECATYSGKIRKQEASLRALLNSPAPPPELAENIRRGVRLESRTDVVRQVWFGAAASVLLVVGVSMFSLFSAHYQREHMPLAQNVLYHINDEARHLHEPGPVSTQRVHAVLARFGAELGGDIGQIRFVAECVMRNRTGVHLIINGQLGPVTVFLMPGEQIPAVMPVESDRLQGEIVPAHWGALAVVGEQGEPIDAIATRVAHAVHWPENGRALSTSARRYAAARRFAAMSTPPAQAAGFRLGPKAGPIGHTADCSLAACGEG